MRRIRHLFLAGQIQPKMSIFSPHSKNYNIFIKKLLRHLIKKSFNEDKYASVKKLQQMVPQMKGV